MKKEEDGATGGLKDENWNNFFSNNISFLGCVLYVFF